MNNLMISRFVLFIVFFIFFLVIQFIFPLRPYIKQRWKFMLSNLIVAILNNGILILLVLIPLRASEIANNNGFGLFNIIQYHNEFSVIFSIIVLDITIYFQHRLFHQNNLLWKLHSVHHIDPMLDTTSGFRIHPLEMIISNFIKVSVILLLGISIKAVLLFEIILNTTAMFNHSNIKTHTVLENFLRKVLITPKIHLIHHSVNWSETNSNYGFSVPWWDWVFKTYTSTPKNPYETMDLGIDNMPNKKYILFPGMLKYPFKKH